MSIPNFFGSVYKYLIGCVILPKVFRKFSPWPNPILIPMSKSKSKLIA